VHPVGVEIVGYVGDDQVASWRERRQVAGDDTGRVVVIRDVVQARDPVPTSRNWRIPLSRRNCTARTDRRIRKTEAFTRSLVFNAYLITSMSDLDGAG
jgi:hypothetical protein